MTTVPEIYKNRQNTGAIRDVRFAVQDGVSLAFVRLRPDMEPADGWLKDAALTPVSDVSHDGARLVIARLGLTASDTLKALANKGEALALPVQEAKGFNPWLWRGITSFVGQSLQLLSSYKSVDPKTGKATSQDNNAIFTFAALNIVANITNIVFGSQKKEDTHQLHMLESKVNDSAKAAGASGALPDPKEKRVSLHKDIDPSRTIGQKTYDMLQKISITGGEIGLRTLGSFGLAFPMNRWHEGFSTLRQTGSIAKTYHTMRVPDKATFAVGLTMLTGKFVSLLSKEPDPYNPKPQGLIDRMREKVTFPASSVIEGGAAGYMMYDRFANKRIKLGNTIYRDHFGGVGNGVFIGGYGIRFAAPYGSREVKLRELYAHSADALAHVPTDKISEQLAHTVLMLDEHFKDKSPGVEVLYSELATRLKTYHGIDVVKPTPPAEHAPTHSVPIAEKAPDTRVQTVSQHQRVQANELQNAMA